MLSYFKKFISVQFILITLICSIIKAKDFDYKDKTKGTSSTSSTPIDSDFDKSALLIRNNIGENNQLPRNFRSTKDLDDGKTILALIKLGFTREAAKERLRQLKGLDIGGSAQPSEEQFYGLGTSLYKNFKIWIIDLRLETHVMLNGLPFSRYAELNSENWGKSLDSVLRSESEYAKSLSETSTVFYHTTLKRDRVDGKGRILRKVKVWSGEMEKLNLKSSLTEEATLNELNQKLLLSKSSFLYSRVPSPDLHELRPDAVEAIVEIEKKRVPGTLLHFHCAAGRGRTTSAMVIVDIMHHYKSFSAEEIMKSQEAIGGAPLYENNLIEIEQVGSQVDLRMQLAKQRETFIHRFYLYTQEQAPLFKVKYSTWIEKKFPTETTKTRP